MFKYILIVLSVFLQPVLADIGTSGMKIVHEVEPGQLVHGKLPISNFGDESAMARVDQGDFHYRVESGFTYPSRGSQERSNGDWIELSTRLLEIPAEQTRDLEYTIKVPEQLPKPGTYWSVIFVHTDPPKQMNSKANEQGVALGMEIVPRIAVQVVTHVGGDGARQVEVVGSGYDSRESRLYFDLENTGDRRMELQPRLTLFNSADGKETLRIEEPNNWGINPSCSWRYQIGLPETVSPGHYVVLLIMEDDQGTLYSGQYPILVQRPASSNE